MSAPVRFITGQLIDIRSSSDNQTQTISQAYPSEQFTNHALHSEIVGILSGTADGCIREIGYYGLVEKYENLKRNYVLLRDRGVALDKKVAELESEVNRLTRENAILHQTLNLHTDERYRLLDKKYHYVLNLLKEHHSVRGDTVEEGLINHLRPSVDNQTNDAAPHTVSVG